MIVAAASVRDGELRTWDWSVPVVALRSRIVHEYSMGRGPDGENDPPTFPTHDLMIEHGWHYDGSSTVQEALVASPELGVCTAEEAFEGSNTAWEIKACHWSNPDEDESRLKTYSKGVIAAVTEKVTQNAPGKPKASEAAPAKVKAAEADDDAPETIVAWMELDLPSPRPAGYKKWMARSGVSNKREVFIPINLVGPHGHLKAIADGTHIVEYLGVTYVPTEWVISECKSAKERAAFESNRKRMLAKFDAYEHE